MSTVDDEVRRIEAALRVDGWADRTSLAREMSTWSGLAREVNAYLLEIEDYTNDLCSRDYLAAMLARASVTLRIGLESELTPLDEAFRAATVDDELGRLCRHIRIGTDEAWWWHRVPRSGPLAEELSRG